MLRINDVWFRLPSYPDQVGGFEIYTVVVDDGVRTPEQFPAPARWSRIAPDLICRTPETRPVSYRRVLYRRQPMAARLVVEVTRQLGGGRTCPESETDQTSAIGHG